MPGSCGLWRRYDTDEQETFRRKASADELLTAQDQMPNEVERLHAQYGPGRIFARGFAMPYIRAMEPIVDSRYAILRQQLDSLADRGEVFDLRKYITYCIVDILGELAFGEPLGNQRDCDPEKIPPVSEALWAACVLGQMPSIAPAAQNMAAKLPLPGARAMQDGRNRLVALAVRNVKARLDDPGMVRDDILGIIMSATEEKTGKHLSNEQVVMEAFTLLVGGTHTTGNTLHVLLANMARHPEHLKRFVAEIDERLPTLKPEQAAYSMVGLEEKLDFVNACIKENYRKDPVATFNMTRVPPEDAFVDGHHVPAGVSPEASVS
ncbi:hypothetical protein LTS10_003717 [Elasticomyces elasticus]|nr:hypothetical protein LTS10_003717 [Elasticomyces elasticus]